MSNEEKKKPKRNWGQNQAEYLAALARNVWVVTATRFLTDVSSQMILNLLPLFLANVLGVRIRVSGFIEGIAETMASLLRVFSGWLSNPLGQRKWLTAFPASFIAGLLWQGIRTRPDFGPSAPFLLGPGPGVAGVQTEGLVAAQGRTTGT